MRSVMMILAASALTTTTMFAPAAAEAKRPWRGAEPSVYTLGNAPSGNEVLLFERTWRGLRQVDAVPTGGKGTGAGLGSQGALAMSEDGRWLLAVNPGSHDVSLLSVRHGRVRLVDRQPSGGEMPISVAIHGRDVYVLNAGGAGGISGFEIRGHRLRPVESSTRPLSSDMAGPAQIAFTPDGDALIVTEKMTSCITVYELGHDGTPGAPTCHPSSGMTPFGFAFAAPGRDLFGHRLQRLIVSEAFGGAPDGSAVSSYLVADDGTPEPVSESVPTTETAACWIAITEGGHYAYTTNTGSASITGYAIAGDGELTPLDEDGRTAVTAEGGRPIDAAIGGVFGRTLFVLDGGLHGIFSYYIHWDGRLFPLGVASGLPAGAVGLIAD